MNFIFLNNPFRICISAQPIWCILLAFILSGCLPSKQPPLLINYYTLDYISAPSTSNKRPLPAIVAVDRFSSSPEYYTDKIIYQEKHSMLSTYNYHRWRANPADIVTYYLTRDLQASKSFQAVTTMTGRLTPTHRIEGIVDKFLEVDGDDYWQAVISVTVTIIKESEPDISKQVLAQESFTETSPCKTKHPLSVSEAMAISMSKISQSIHSLMVENL